jgi:1,4-alpha-glucan branching enzyme
MENGAFPKPKTDGCITLHRSGCPSAEHVAVVGDFNVWAMNTLPMAGDGWQVTFDAPAGTYAYLFVVDGGLIPDPANGSHRNPVDINSPSMLTVLEPQR